MSNEIFFQTFDAASAPEAIAPRLATLRTVLAGANLDGFLIPRADAHRGENVAACDERLAYVTGFTGSAGLAIVGQQAAALLIDGRYSIQARTETPGDLFDFLDLHKDAPGDWIAKRLGKTARIGFDPWLHTKSEIEKLEQAGVDLVATTNLIDQIWADRPAPPATRIHAQPSRLTGKSHPDKRAEIGAAIAPADWLVLTLPDSIAWLLNIRGNDIAHTPVPRAFAIVHKSGVTDLFVTDPQQITPSARATLGTNVTLRQKSEFEGAVQALDGTVRLDPASAPVAVQALVRGEIHWQSDPVIAAKTCKTHAELAGARAAHERDALAMIRFLCWLDTHPAQASLTEIDVVKELERCRRATNALEDISFETICGAGPNGAIVHYRVSEASNRSLGTDSVLLVDSGGQYVDGTTDITRTIALGTPPREAVAANTLVLEGMIAMSRLRWPEGLSGQQLDAIARAPLWMTGRDYDHGTGHGVGAYLGVHEGPAALSLRSAEPLRTGMILSNEPGYYVEGAFGIRIENLLIVRPPETPEGGDRAMLHFETLTTVPIDRRLIDTARLSPAARGWLDAYHANIWERFSAQLSPSEQNWLKQATAPL